MSVSTFATPSGIQQYEQVFTSSGTWTKPAGVKTCEVTVVGASNGTGSAGGATSAGGYFKGIVDVSSLSSVSVTVGAAGSNAGTGVGVGGSSSFGNLIVAPGGSAGAWYNPSLQGYVPGAVPIVTGPYNILNYSTGTQASYSRTANNRIFLYSSVHGIATSTDGLNWTATSGNMSHFSYSKYAYGNNLYVHAYIDDNISSSSIRYSSDGVTFSTGNLPFGVTITDIAYGPAGFLLTYGGSFMKSTNATSWTTLTTTGLPAGNFYIQGTSSYYYAFRKSTGQTTAYRSTDGATWTSFTLNATTNTGDPKYYTSYANKVYVLNGTTTMQIIDGTTVTSSTLASASGNFQTHNTIIMTISGGYQSALFPSGILNLATIPGAGPMLITSNGIVLGYNNSNTVGSWYTAIFYTGQQAIAAHPGYTNPSAGVLGPGTATPSTTYSLATPGRGDDSGWGFGADNTNGAFMQRTPGSGVAGTSTLGNSGIVRVRWWA